MDAIASDILSKLATAAVIAVFFVIGLQIVQLANVAREYLGEQKFKEAKLAIWEFILAAEKRIEPFDPETGEPMKRGGERLTLVLDRAAERFPWLDEDMIRIWIDAFLADMEREVRLIRSEPAEISHRRYSGGSGDNDIYWGLE